MKSFDWTWNLAVTLPCCPTTLHTDHLCTLCPMDRSPPQLMHWQWPGLEDSAYQCSWDHRAGAQTSSWGKATQPQCPSVFGLDGWGWVFMYNFDPSFVLDLHVLHTTDLIASLPSARDPPAHLVRWRMRSDFRQCCSAALIKDGNTDSQMSALLLETPPNFYPLDLWWLSNAKHQAVNVVEFMINRLLWALVSHCPCCII